MSANHGNWVAGLPFLANSECYNRGAISSEVVLATWNQGGGPTVAFLDFVEAGFGEPLDCGVDGMVSCRAVSRSSDIFRMV